MTPRQKTEIELQKKIRALHSKPHTPGGITVGNYRGGGCKYYMMDIPEAAINHGIERFVHWYLIGVISTSGRLECKRMFGERVEFLDVWAWARWYGLTAEKPTIKFAIEHSEKDLSIDNDPNIERTSREEIRSALRKARIVLPNKKIGKGAKLLRQHDASIERTMNFVSHHRNLERPLPGR